MQRRLVGEHAVRQLAVLAEALAVIRGDDDERGPRERRQPIEERAERAIDERDLAVVRLRAVLSRRDRRAAGTASADRTTCTHAKNLPGCLPIQSTARETTTSARRSGIAKLDVALHLRHLIVVDVEPRREAEALREREAADEGAGREAQRP